MANAGGQVTGLFSQHSTVNEELYGILGQSHDTSVSGCIQTRFTLFITLGLLNWPATLQGLQAGCMAWSPKLSTCLCITAEFTLFGWAVLSTPELCIWASAYIHRLVLKWHFDDEEQEITVWMTNDTLKKKRNCAVHIPLNKGIFYLPC